MQIFCTTIPKYLNPSIEFSVEEILMRKIFSVEELFSGGIFQWRIFSAEDLFSGGLIQWRIFQWRIFSVEDLSLDDLFAVDIS